MRIDLKVVKGKQYLQYVSSLGFLVHAGPVDDLESWRLAFHLLKDDLESEWIRQFNRLKPFFHQVFKIRTQEQYENLLRAAMSPPSQDKLDKALEVLNRKFSEHQEIVGLLKEKGFEVKE